MLKQADLVLVVGGQAKHWPEIVYPCLYRTDGRREYRELILQGLTGEWPLPSYPMKNMGEMLLTTYCPSK